MTEILEGRWDDLVARHDLHGRRVRIIMLEGDAQQPQDPWLRSLWAWAESHTPVNHPVDDSRDSIYSGTADDPR